MHRRYDAVVVGSGPNGLAAAITLATAGYSVLVIEGSDTIGGGTRSRELTLPGFIHDVCAAVHPLAAASPFFRTLPLARHGVAWVQPPVPLAHPFDDGTAILLHRSVDETAHALGRDAAAYASVMRPFVESWQDLIGDVLGPLRLPRHPLLVGRFGLAGLHSVHALVHRHFREPPARALFAGLAAHSMLPLDWLATGGFALILGMLAHAVGWPFCRGGSQQLATALGQELVERGGEIVTGWMVQSIDELPEARTILFDVTPRQLLAIAGSRFPACYRAQLARYRYGPGAFKIDWALAGPIPWKAAACARAGTIHLGGTFEEIARAESQVWQGQPADQPFVLLAQPSLFDPSRAPAGQHTAWAYCHVPNGSTVDQTERIETQVERFAPGFRARILARHVMPPAALERYDPNYVGGDINGGAQDLRQLFTRPTPRLNPYATPVGGLYLCSSSTPPGGGIHGLCGYFAARAALAGRVHSG